LIHFNIHDLKGREKPQAGIVTLKKRAELFQTNADIRMPSFDSAKSLLIT
jgi:hypothetical protein